MAFFEFLSGIGDALSGKFMKIIGGRRPDGTANAFSADTYGNIYTRLHRIDTNSSLVDTLYRQRTSNQFIIFQSSFLYGRDPDQWSQSLTGSATITHTLSQAAVQMQCTTASGDIAIRQTKRYMHHPHGNSLRIMITAIMGSLKSNVLQRIGYFDDNNGLYFEQDGFNLKVVYRTDAGGSVVNNTISQSSWNIDPMNGTGKSGVTLNTGNIQTFIIDINGANNYTKMGFVIGSEIIYCHEFIHTNSLSTAVFGAIGLPIRLELRNTGTVASSTSLMHFGAAAITEGQCPYDAGKIYAINTGQATSGRTVSSGSTVPILSVRPKISQNRSIIIPRAFTVLPDRSDDFLIEVHIGGTLTGGAWVNASPIAEYNASAISISDSHIIYAAYGNGPLNISLPTSSDTYVAADIDGNTEPVSIVARAIKSQGFYASLIWQEVY